VALARCLSESAPSWAAWRTGGDPASGLLVSGAAPEDWEGLAAEFRRWAVGHGLGPVIRCDHDPYELLLVALDGNRPFFVLSIAARRVVRGATVVLADALGPLTELDAHGFRRLRPGAEAVLVLLDAVADEGMEPDWQRLRALNVAVLAGRDHAGVRDASRRLLGPAGRSMVQLAEAVEMGGWDRRALSNLQRWCVARALVEPVTLAARMRHRLTGPCALARAVAGGRRPPADDERWLRAIALDHAVEATVDPRLSDSQQLKPQTS
jgi:hypothetical protein